MARTAWKAMNRCWCRRTRQWIAIDRKSESLQAEIDSRRKPTMATLAAMNEKPATPPFIQYHVPPPTQRPDPVAVGIKMGITTTALLGIGYALLVPIWLHLLGNGPTITPL